MVEREKPDPSYLSWFPSATAWWKDCEENHALCRPIQPTPLPTRVVDVLSRDEPFLRETDGQFGDYLALSYCWGQHRDNVMMTFGPRSRGRRGLPDPKPNIDFHRTEIPISVMPKTLQDAIIVCRQLGVKYLWIDALCIIQGDEEEWRRENLKMADVYANARLTIAADNAEGNNSGFLNRLGHKTVPQEPGRSGVPSYDRNHILIKGSIESRTFNDTLLSPLSRDEPLNNRAWSLAEAIFSNKTLHFTSSSVSWECNERRHSQNGDSWYVQDDDIDSFRIFRNMTVAKRHSTVASLYQKWHTIIQLFSRRQINNHPEQTYRDDEKLVALSRVANKFSDILREATRCEDEYLAGIWKGDLLRSLLWTVERAPNQGVCGDGSGSRSSSSGPDHVQQEVGWRAPESPRAPSWSWAAIEGPVFFNPLLGFEPSLQVGDVSVRHVDGGEPFGRVLSGRLVAWGPVVHGLVLRIDVPAAATAADRLAAHRCGVYCPESRGEYRFICDVPLTAEDDGRNVSCLYVGKGGRGDLTATRTSGYHACLLLLASTGASGIFGRIGTSTYTVRLDDIDGLLQSAKYETVIIV